VSSVPVTFCKYCRITATNSPSFRTTFSASLTNRKALQPQSSDGGCYVSRRMTSPPLRMHKYTDITHTLPNCNVSLGSLTLPTPETGHFVTLFLYRNNVLLWLSPPLRKNWLALEYCTQLTWVTLHSVFRAFTQCWLVKPPDRSAPRMVTPCSSHLSVSDTMPQRSTP
jgi:hypothetical protein